MLLKMSLFENGQRSLPSGIRADVRSILRSSVTKTDNSRSAAVAAIRQ